MYQKEKNLPTINLSIFVSVTVDDHLMSKMFLHFESKTIKKTLPSNLPNTTNSPRKTPPNRWIVSHFFHTCPVLNKPIPTKKQPWSQANLVFDLEVKWFRTWLRWATCTSLTGGWWVSVLGPCKEIFNAFKNQDLCQKLETRNRMPAPFFVPTILNEIFLERGIF